MHNTIYVADDDKNTREMIAAFLEKEGFQVTTFADGTALQNACQVAKPDLVVLDVMMPGTDGFTVCSSLRVDDPLIPIIIVSAKDSPFDRVTGLTLGCDDYLIKPFLPMELVARVRARLRRSQITVTEQDVNKTLTFGPLKLYPGRRNAMLSGKKLSLTPMEFDFMAYLISHSDAAVSRKDLMKSLWGLDWQVDARAADDLVKRLRRKLREAGCPVKIETVWGYGFRLAMEDNS